MEPRLSLVMTLPDGRTEDTWVPQTELVTAQERIIELDQQLERIIEHYTDPEAKAFELQCELRVRDKWIRKLIAVRDAAGQIIEQVPELPPLIRGSRESQKAASAVLRLRFRRVGPEKLEALWDALVEVHEFGKGGENGDNPE